MLEFRVCESAVLRTLIPDDAPELYAVVDENRRYLREWLPWLDANTSVRDSEAFIHSIQKQYDAQLGFQCGIVVDGHLAGMCGYHPIDRSSHSVTIGYWLAQSATGRGVVTRSVKLLIDYAFRELGLARVWIPVAEGNARSRAVAERLGLIADGIEQDAENLYGTSVNHVRYLATKCDWPTG